MKRKENRVGERRIIQLSVAITKYLRQSKRKGFSWLSFTGFSPPLAALLLLDLVKQQPRPEVFEGFVVVVVVVVVAFFFFFFWFGLVWFGLVWFGLVCEIVFFCVALAVLELAL
jgi:VIT1/CCC1 family predicted Fe2+/Mn2+ transporter